MGPEFMLLTVLFAFCVTVIHCNTCIVEVANYTCIILDSDITGILHYQQGSVMEQIKFNVSEEHGCVGSCLGGQYLTINFEDDMIKNGSLTMHFKKGKDGSFRMSNSTLEVLLNGKSNGTEMKYLYVMDEHSGLEVGANKDEAYKCSDVPLNFNENTFVNLHNMRLIAYAHLNVTQFPEKQEYDICQLDIRTSDLVPVVVGLCLATLVIVVLTAYLIGRARAKRQGYASV